MHMYALRPSRPWASRRRTGSSASTDPSKVPASCALGHRLHPSAPSPVPTPAPSPNIRDATLRSAPGPTHLRAGVLNAMVRAGTLRAGLAEAYLEHFYRVQVRCPPARPPHLPAHPPARLACLSASTLPLAHRPGICTRYALPCTSLCTPLCSTSSATNACGTRRRKRCARSAVSWGLTNRATRTISGHRRRSKVGNAVFVVAAPPQLTTLASWAGPTWTAHATKDWAGSFRPPYKDAYVASFKQVAAGDWAPREPRSPRPLARYYVHDAITM